MNVVICKSIMKAGFKNISVTNIPLLCLFLLFSNTGMHINVGGY